VRILSKRLRYFLISIGFAISFQPVPASAATENLLLSNINEYCGYSETVNSSNRLAFKFYSNSTRTITDVQVRMYNTNSVSGTSVKIYDSSGFTGQNMSTLLGTLNYVSFDNITKIAKYSGSVALTSSNYRWLEFYNPSSTAVNPCGTSSTSYSNLDFGWRIYPQSATPPSGSEVNNADWWVMSMLLVVPDPPTITTPSVNPLASKGLSSAISVNVNTAGRVYFYANGKKIPKCIGVSTTGTAPSLSATCNWVPSLRGAATITAKLVVSPTSSVTSSASMVKIQGRNTNR
jgi:hypothetical protein